MVPATERAETISQPSCLKLFNQKFLGSCKVSPTRNQIRKLFHRELMKLTKNEKAMKDVMTILDAHGRQVQEKHYILFPLKPWIPFSMCDLMDGSLVTA